MRNKAFLLAIVLIMITTSGCIQSCRNFFRRGAPCGTTAMAPPMMGAPRALANAFVTAPQPVQTVVPQMVMPHPRCCCQQPVSECQCCDPCPPCNPCTPPCDTGCSMCGPGYVDANYGCGGETVGQGEWFGGYVEDRTSQDKFVPQGSGASSDYRKDPSPGSGN